MDGDFIEILDYAGLAHLKDRVTVKGTFQIEKGISPADLARLKTALKYKGEVARAAKEAEEHAIEFAKHRKKLDSLTKQRATLERQFKRARGTWPTSPSVSSRPRATGCPASGRDLPCDVRRRRPRRHSLRPRRRCSITRTPPVSRATCSARPRKVWPRQEKRLAAAGHRLDVALAKISDKLAKLHQAGTAEGHRQDHEEAGGYPPGEGPQVPHSGAEPYMTAVDIGTILFALFSDSKEGVVGGEGDGEGTGTAGW